MERFIIIIIPIKITIEITEIHIHVGHNRQSWSIHFTTASGEVAAVYEHAYCQGFGKEINDNI